MRDRTSLIGAAASSPYRFSRRKLMEKAAGAGVILGASLPKPLLADGEDEDRLAQPNPIPGGGAAFAPFAIFVHHNALNPAVPLANINDPSQITDFKGFVGLTHIRGGGTGTDTASGTSMPLAFRADMGFSQGEFIGADGKHHERTFAFV
jgi:hypothetical protein